jgi:hypothetical protein
MDTAWQCLTSVEAFTSFPACWVNGGQHIIISIVECYNNRSITKQNILTRRIFANSPCERHQTIHLQRHGRPRMRTRTPSRFLPRRSPMRFIQRATKPHRSQADVQASGQPQRIRLPPPTTATTATTTTTILTTKYHTRALELLTLKLLRRLANDVADNGRRQTCNLAFLPGSLRQHEEGWKGLFGIPGARDGRRVASRTCRTA